MQSTSQPKAAVNGHSINPKAREMGRSWLSTALCLAWDRSPFPRRAAGGSAGERRPTGIPRSWRTGSARAVADLHARLMQFAWHTHLLRTIGIDDRRWTLSREQVRMHDPALYARRATEYQEYIARTGLGSPEHGRRIVASLRATARCIVANAGVRHG